MRLVCIDCAESIPAENINVQDLVAVCPACDTVFRFNLDEDKPKNRKIKAPERVTVYDDALLYLTYNRVFDQETRGALLGIGFATFMFTVILITTTGGFLANDIPMFVPLFVGTLWSLGLYTLAMLYFTTTKIFSDGESILAQHQYLPHPLQEKDSNIAIQSIERVFIEESYSSKRRGDAERSYHIYAETYDGGRVLILKGVPENYARYIQQEISRQVEKNDNLLESRLVIKDEVREAINNYEDTGLTEAEIIDKQL